MTRYNPLCERCGVRPKMDRCGICEECWYSPLPKHSRVCEDHAFQWHTATGGDAPCICGTGRRGPLA